LATKLGKPNFVLLTETFERSVVVKKTGILLIATMCLISGELCLAEDSQDGIRNRETLTDGFWGLNNWLEDSGIKVSFGLTQIYQRNAKGGLSTNNRKGEYSGSYDLEIVLDTNKLFGFDGSFFVHGEGGWTDSEGIDGTSVGSLFGVNADAIGNRSLNIVEAFYETSLTDKLSLYAGKIDFTGFFDSSAFANDESTQFLNGSLVNNAAIPFPDYSLGVIANYNISDNWYVMGGVADAQADGRETGFNTAFHSEDYFFYIFETGITPQLDSANGPLAGAYRAGIWYDPQDKTHLSNGRNVRDDRGFYLSFDQMLYKEKADREDSQGLGVFGRYGWADSKVNEVTNFWSIGLQYLGLLEGRDDDVLGVGYAQGFVSDQASMSFSADYEAVVEAYYNARITPWLNISPCIQYVVNPGAASDASNAVICGLRVQTTF
jgi:porin